MNYKAPNLHQSHDVLMALIETYRMPVLFITQSGHIWLKNQAMDRYMTGNTLFDQSHNKIKWCESDQEHEKQYLDILEDTFSDENTDSVDAIHNCKKSIEIEKGKYAIINKLATHKEIDTQKNYKQIQIAMLYIFDYQRYETPSQTYFNQIFGFNKTEAQVCQLLLKNYSIKDMCTYKNITENTGREYIKRVYHKTGCKNLFELMNLICSLPMFD